MPQVGFPYSDPGSLQGGVREHRAILNALQADAFRSASQSQNVGQAARAFSGASVTNAQGQTEAITQTVTADNTKAVTIAAGTATNANDDNFNFNYLQQYIAGADAADYLARGAANVAQDQGADQSAFGKLENFSGVDSTAQNTITQGATVTQRFAVDLDANVQNTTITTAAADDAFSQSRFRTIEANLEDQSAQAIFTSGQRQGSAEAALSQVAVADGSGTGVGSSGTTGVNNDLTQTAGIVQTANEVTLEGTFNLERNENASLTPRTTDLLVNINALNGVNSAINSSAASQEQALVQSVAGGVDEAGNVTENGGRADNTASSTATNDEETDVLNSITITI